MDHRTITSLYTRSVRLIRTAPGGQGWDKVRRPVFITVAQVIGFVMKLQHQPDWKVTG